MSLPHFDKLAHGAAYGVLGFLLALGGFRGLSASLRTKTTCILLTGAALGILDEVHQIFVPGRSSDPLDAAMDVLGVVLGLVLYRWVVRI